MAERIIIKKYENRRLYDTSNSRYVNLDEIAQMVRKGGDVQVVDSKSGEDITRLILTQIIVEDAKERESVLPLELLRQLIVASDRARSEFFEWYLKAAIDSYHRAQEALQNRIAPVLNPLEFWSNFFSSKTPPPSETNKEEIAELKRRLEEMERRLAEQTGRSASKQAGGQD